MTLRRRSDTPLSRIARWNRWLIHCYCSPNALSLISYCIARLRQRCCVGRKRKLRKRSRLYRIILQYIKTMTSARRLKRKFVSECRRGLTIILYKTTFSPLLCLGCNIEGTVKSFSKKIWPDRVELFCLFRPFQVCWKWLLQLGKTSFLMCQVPF